MVKHIEMQVEAKNLPLAHADNLEVDLSRGTVLDPITIPFAMEVDPNEKAYFLQERTVAPKSMTEPRRYQFIWVQRNGELAVFVRDMGVAVANMDEFEIPSDWEHSIAELADLADYMRDNSGLKEVLAEAHETSTLIEDAMTLAQVREQVKNNRTFFGPGQSAPTAQRTGYMPRSK